MYELNPSTVQNPAVIRLIERYIVSGEVLAGVKIYSQEVEEEGDIPNLMPHCHCQNDSPLS